MREFSNVVGLFGVCLILVAYFLMQIRRLKANGKWFSLYNALGSSCILFSLYFDWNLSAAIVEFLWAVISIFGFFNALRYNKKI